MGKRGKRPPRPPKHIREMMKTAKAEYALSAVLEEDSKKEMPIDTGQKHYVSKGVQTEDLRVLGLGWKPITVQYGQHKEHSKVEDESESKMDVDGKWFFTFPLLDEAVR